MAWFKVDDKFHSHPKVMDLSPAAVGLWTLAGSWCADYLTDGEIRKGQLRRLGGSESEANELVESGLWESVEGGWQFRDWTDYQPTKEQVKADREVSKRRWAMNNNPELRKVVRGRDGDNCRYCGKKVSWSDRRGPDGGTYDHVHPMSKGGDETAANIVVACRDCNVRKGARTPDQAGITLHPPRTNLDKTQNTPRSTQSYTKPPVPDPVPGSSKEEQAAFDTWWALYPKKVGKGHAKTAFKGALKKTSLEELSKATTRYAEECKREKTERKFIKNPATWLNAESWDDELDATKHGTPSTSYIWD